jgi:hypothetical protein
MTNEQILELAKTCGFDDFTGEKENYWECGEEQLLKFALQIRKQTLEDVISVLQDVPNPQANQTAINRIEMELNR